MLAGELDYYDDPIPGPAEGADRCELCLVSTIRNCENRLLHLCYNCTIITTITIQSQQPSPCEWRVNIVDEQAVKETQ